MTPDGRVIIADLPGELVELPWALGQVEPCEIVGPANDPTVPHDVPHNEEKEQRDGQKEE